MPHFEKRRVWSSLIQLVLHRVLAKIQSRENIFKPESTLNFTFNITQVLWINETSNLKPGSNWKRLDVSLLNVVDFMRNGKTGAANK